MPADESTDPGGDSTGQWQSPETMKTNFWGS